MNAQPHQGRPLASVVLPTHDRPEWLAMAVTSVLEGDFRDFEIIVSNNGRPEHTEKLRTSILDARIRWIERTPCGVLENLVSALLLARGKYVAILHDDDWWHPRLLSALISPLEAHPEAVLAFADHWHVDTAGQIDLAVTDYQSRASGRATLAAGLHPRFDTLVVRETIPIPGCVFRRTALSPADFPPQVGAANDIWMAYLLSKTGGAAYVCRDRLVYCRKHVESDFVSQSMANVLAAVYCQRHMLQDPHFAAHYSELERRLAAREQSIGGMLLRQGSRSAARRHLRAALRLRPTAKAAGGWGASWVAPTCLLARL